MKIKKYLEKYSMSHREFARNAGINHSTISHYLSGKNKNLSIPTINKIIKATKGEISLLDLTEGSEKER